MKPSQLKTSLQFISGLLAIVKWLPVGQWRQIAVTLSTIIGVVLGMLSRCEDTSSPPTVPTATPTPIPTATPSPKPTPQPPRILIDRMVVKGNPFTVRYTAPFVYNTHLWADKYRLGYMGKDVDGGHVLYAVVLKTPGKRRLTVRNEAGSVLASEVVEVNP